MCVSIKLYCKKEISHWLLTILLHVTYSYHFLAVTGITHLTPSCRMCTVSMVIRVPFYIPKFSNSYYKYKSAKISFFKKIHLGPFCIHSTHWSASSIMQYFASEKVTVILKMKIDYLLKQLSVYINYLILIKLI